MDDRLRLLARWHARRRDLDSLLSPLLTYGPAAVDLVSDRLPVIEQAVAAEQLAFEAFRSGAGRTPPTGPSTPPVDELARARRRMLESQVPVKE